MQFIKGLIGFSSLFTVLLCFILPGPPEKVPIKISDSLIRSFEVDNEVRYIIKFSNRANLSRASALKTKAEKGAYVFNELNKIAHEDQREVTRLLSYEKISYRKLAIVNAIVVTTNLEKAYKIASFPKVKTLMLDPWVKQNLGRATLNDNNILGNASNNIAEPEWGLMNIGADKVWAQGFEGEGITIGGADTGYEWEHPAIRKQYRGLESDTVNHNYHWHDAIHEINPGNNDTSVVASNNPCGLDVNFPCDDNNHGTHTMGTMVGQDSMNIIGVAPKAKWVACRNMERGWGTPSTYIECFEWFLAPTDLLNENPNPALAPHVINNSWSCPEQEGCNPENWTLIQEAVENLKMAGVFVVVSAGNEGPGCETVARPAAMFEESFTIGAYNIEDNIAGFSSRGPVTIDSSGRMKPDMSAPGVNVRSSIKNGNYANFSGTSMAGPHLAGAVALLLNIDTTLLGKVDSVERILLATARQRTTDQECGGVPGDQIPNNTYGQGNLDVFDAYLLATGQVISADKNVALDPEEITVYPNPTSNEIFWKTESDQKILKIELRDAQGRLIVSKMQIEKSGKLSVTKFPTGIYYLKFYLEKGLLTKRVFIGK